MGHFLRGIADPEELSVRVLIYPGLKQTKNLFVIPIKDQLFSLENPNPSQGLYLPLSIQRLNTVELCPKSNGAQKCI